MSQLLDQLHDEELDFTVTITDSEGETNQYEFLDIVLRNEIQYAVVCPLEDDGYVDIFRIQVLNGKEIYIREKDETVLDEVFEIFRLKNEDEFDFD
ncbi:MAG: DUF1292 domain-containing protein [Clostridia bacterium]|nr:DUF1292 domain-containing protein [Clostridia bacterium]